VCQCHCGLGQHPCTLLQVCYYGMSPMCCSAPYAVSTAAALDLCCTQLLCSEGPLTQAHRCQVMLSPAGIPAITAAATQTDGQLAEQDE
jgi:hypothetical protein